jgi:two-component system, chemotaxis family, CheB/CheR fusion protein
MTTRARAEANGSNDLRGAHSDAVSVDSVSTDLVGILDTVDLPIVAVGRDFTVARFNQGAAAVLGLTPSVIGRSPRDIQVLTNVIDLEEVCAQVIADGAPFRREVRDGDRWFLLRIAPYTRSDRQIGGTVLTFTNVTAFRASMAQAIYEREYTKAILNTVIGPLVVLDADLRVQTANRAFYAMFQVTREETQGVPLYDLGSHDWDTPRLWTLLKETISNNSEFQTLEVEHDFPAIGRRTVLLDARRLSREGNPGHMILLAFQDITERKEAEVAKVRLAAIVESSDDAIISKDLNGVITSWNHGAEQLFGYRDSEIIGKPITLLIPPDRHDEEAVILPRIRRGKRIEHYETVRRRKDGSLLDISLSVSPIKDAQGRIIGASKIARDITRRKQIEAALHEAKEALAKSNEELEKRVKERTVELELANMAFRNQTEEHKKLEKQLWQAQKMESLGTLAGGVAHDFNNILNIIKGYAGLIRQNPSVDEKIAESLNVIEETVERGAYGVRQLLTLARKTEARFALTNPNDLLSDLSKLLKQTFPKTIDVALELDAKLPSISVDPNQINQALLNLCVNARDAMSGGGRLTLKALLVEGGKVQDLTATAERYVCMAVKDTGAGMDAAVRNRIFEPFFTTKSVGEGTGLGLAMVYGIVKNHNGFIDVESELGHGTTFRLYFPIAPFGEKPAVDEMREELSAAPMKNTNHHKTVLVAEDEEKMIYLLRKALLRNGCDVLIASDGEQAIDLYHHRQQDIDAVLLDIGLPKISGWEVILRMKKENPNIKVIVTSGYIEPDLKSKMQHAGVGGFVEKPYNPNVVVQMLCNLFATD